MYASLPPTFFGWDFANPIQSLSMLTLTTNIYVFHQYGKQLNRPQYHHHYLVNRILSFPCQLKQKHRLLLLFGLNLKRFSF